MAVLKSFVNFTAKMKSYSRIINNSENALKTERKIFARPLSTAFTRSFPRLLSGHSNIKENHSTNVGNAYNFRGRIGADNFIGFLFVAIGLIVAGCGSSSTTSAGSKTADEIKAIVMPSDSAVNPHDSHLGYMPDQCSKMHINLLGGPLATVFNDSNHVHLEAAVACGNQPVAVASHVWNTSRPLFKVSSNEDYYIDRLTSSYPYLVPEAYNLLGEIGRNFRDSLESRGGGDYRIKITSMLRTEPSVRKLKRGNVNAVEGSTHLYGTTFDISYSNFICDSDSICRTQEDLKNLLAEVLFDLRRQGKCFVKYERKQACFHVTARPVNTTD